MKVAIAAYSRHSGAGTGFAPGVIASRMRRFSRKADRSRSAAIGHEINVEGTGWRVVPVGEGANLPTPHRRTRPGAPVPSKKGATRTLLSRSIVTGPKPGRWVRSGSLSASFPCRTSRAEAPGSAASSAWSRFGWRSATGRSAPPPGLLAALARPWLARGHPLAMPRTVRVVCLRDRYPRNRTNSSRMCRALLVNLADTAPKSPPTTPPCRATAKLSGQRHVGWPV